MSKLNDVASSGKIEEIIRKDETGQQGNETSGSGLSSLLTLPPAVPFLQFNEPTSERRSGRERREADRRLAAREFKVPEES